MTYTPEPTRRVNFAFYRSLGVSGLVALLLALGACQREPERVLVGLDCGASRTVRVVAGEEDSVYLEGCRQIEAHTIQR